MNYKPPHEKTPIVLHKLANDEMNLYAKNGIESVLSHDRGTLMYSRDMINFVVDAMFRQVVEHRRATTFDELYKDATGFNFRDLADHVRASIMNRLSKRIRQHKQQQAASTEAFKNAASSTTQH